MKRTIIMLIAAIAVYAVASITIAAVISGYDQTAPIFDIKIPPGFRDWKLISVAHKAGQQQRFARRSGQ